MWSYTTQLNLDTLGSEQKPVLFIKHSNRCSISAMAFNRLVSEQEKLDEAFSVILVDVVKDRALSQEIAAYYKIQHESPQVIVVHNNRVVYHSSHLGINAQELYDLV
jgi:bacillithiol system protein YtxJ